jgi:hypothetical protein
MAILASLIDQLSDFFGGPKLITGDQLKIVAQSEFGSRSGIVAHAGGGQAAATPLSIGMNTVETVASANDSVLLPLAIPGTECWVANATANSMQVFGSSSNPNNGGAGDTIAVQGSNSQVATGTGVAQATGVMTVYKCLKMGQWKQGALS